ncbi:HAD family hydrolase [Bremerella cremea]|uniref:phosphoglycolate phosphatase n=1 Tax=Blastopirellula marina TaxID=124 RepID=A0A2S8G4U6_9BACT|nr:MULTISPECIES: HAD family hydrolase [Pirellulaceae]PQO39468.1 phosphatase [Blastopirellula marina]RCS50935.1 HAD family hydrolase [Bremerella cremea]
MTALSHLRGIIFDMDGTIVDSGLDFAAMRKEMGLRSGVPILEQLNELSPGERAEMETILHRHEMAGADRATIIDGADRLLAALSDEGRPMAIVTRNSTETTAHTLSRLKIDHFFDIVICREDGPHKPDPWAILEICRRWRFAVDEVVMVGDFELDIQSAVNAGCPSVLYTEGKPPEQVPGADLATHVAVHLNDLYHLLAPGQDSI